MHVSAPLAMAAIIAQSDTDRTLAVRRPDGSYACDDDRDEGVNPRVAEALWRVTVWGAQDKAARARRLLAGTRGGGRTSGGGGW